MTQKFKDKQSDEILLKRIQERIQWDIRVSNSDICLKVRSGVVLLYGYFDQPYRQVAAMKIVSGTEGVQRFEDKTQVLSDYYRSDEDLKRLILKELESQTLVGGEWLSVSVKDGVATLTGSVQRARLKAFAAEATWQLSGIKDCLNHIVIANGAAPRHAVRPGLIRGQSTPRTLSDWNAEF